MPTAVVTGSTGYLGSKIASALGRAGWRTVPLGRQAPAATLRWALGDTPDAAAFDGVDALVHCAYDFTVRSFEEAWEINVEGTRQLLGTAREAGVPRILAISSMSAYEGTHQSYGR